VVEIFDFKVKMGLESVWKNLVKRGESLDSLCQKIESCNYKELNEETISLI
jgi:hypothetical protein